MWKTITFLSFKPVKPTLWPLHTGSLTIWKKWYPFLFSSLKMIPFFAAKLCLLSSKRPVFRDKTLTFQFKMNPLFCNKPLTFHPKWTLLFTVKHWTSKFIEVSTKISPFSRCESWISSKITLYLRILELGCVW